MQKFSRFFFLIKAYKKNSNYNKVFKARVGKSFLSSDISPWGEEERGVVEMSKKDFIQAMQVMLVQRGVF